MRRTCTARRGEFGRRMASNRCQGPHANATISSAAQRLQSCVRPGQQGRERGFARATESGRREGSSVYNGAVAVGLMPERISPCRGSLGGLLEAARADACDCAPRAGGRRAGGLGAVQGARVQALRHQPLVRAGPSRQLAHRCDQHRHHEGAPAPLRLRLVLVQGMSSLLQALGPSSATPACVFYHVRAFHRNAHFIATRCVLDEALKASLLGIAVVHKLPKHRLPDVRRLAQAFIENREDTIIPWIVDVRDIGRAHVLAAEVSSGAGRVFSRLCLHAHL